MNTSFVCAAATENEDFLKIMFQFILVKSCLKTYIGPSKIRFILSLVHLLSRLFRSAHSWFWRCYILFSVRLSSRLFRSV